MTAPIVLGAGPAGSVAAMQLARAGATPILIDRCEIVGDAICGGFLSWRTAQALRELGCDPGEHGAHPVGRLRVLAADHRAEADLPAGGFGLSRHALDTALRNLATEAGARLVIDSARKVGPGVVAGTRREWRSPALFLATGKHDVRGEARPRSAEDPALGLRVRLPASPRLTGCLAGVIELHLFPGGYAGIVLQEDGSANVCLALRKSLLARQGSNPRDVLLALGEANPQFGDRLAGLPTDLPVDTIGSIPYGWIAGRTEEGLYRLGDQAAVIPSLAGEGMAIAVASARAATDAYLSGQGAVAYQQAFSRRVRGPVRISGLLWRLAETASGAKALSLLARRLPSLARLAMRASRI